MNDDRRRVELAWSREHLARIRAVWTAKFTDEDEEITGAIIGKLTDMAEPGEIGRSDNAKFFHMAVACLTLAEGFSENEI